jgi:hypothetical protein
MITIKENETKFYKFALFDFTMSNSIKLSVMSLHIVTTNRLTDVSLHALNISRVPCTAC